jgi:hypothetical protein
MNSFFKNKTMIVIKVDSRSLRFCVDKNMPDISIENVDCKKYSELLDHINQCSDFSIESKGNEIAYTKVNPTMVYFTVRNTNNTETYIEIPIENAKSLIKTAISLTKPAMIN